MEEMWPIVRMFSNVLGAPGRPYTEPKIIRSAKVKVCYQVAPLFLVTANILTLGHQIFWGCGFSRSKPTLVGSATSDDVRNRHVHER